MQIEPSSAPLDTTGTDAAKGRCEDFGAFPGIQIPDWCPYKFKKEESLKRGEEITCDFDYFQTAPDLFLKWSEAVKLLVGIQEFSSVVTNAYDCGAFTCASAYFVAKDLPPRYTQRDIPRFYKKLPGA